MLMTAPQVISDPVDAIVTIVNSGREMSEIERKAMFYGIDALLRSSEGGSAARDGGGRQ